MDFTHVNNEALAELKNLAAALRTSKQFPHTQRAGACLESHLPRQIEVTSAPSDIDDFLTNLQHRYHTPIPEAYLSETVAQQQSQRRQHGVYYTPWPLAQYLTRSAQEIAEREFLGETPIWLDPACGGGVFFLSLLADAQKPLGPMHAWDASPVAAALCGSILEARGHRHVQVKHRDALQQDPTASPLCAGDEPLIIVGNPPYSNFGKRQISPWLARELGKYKPPRSEKKTNLRDAFLLFLRLAESLITTQGRGMLAVVLSTTFLDAITHSQVRASLFSTFDQLKILRLESRTDPADQNLFSIRQPTAACLFLRRANDSISENPKRKRGIFLCHLQGTRNQKLTWLAANSAATTAWEEFQIENRATLAIGRGSGAWITTPLAPSWYVESPSIPEYFNEYISGVQTKNDSLFLARSRTQLEAQIRARFKTFDPAFVQPILVAPFDPWWIYFDPNLLGRARFSVMQHMLRDNLALIFMRQATGEGEYDHFLVTRCLVTDRVFHSRWGAPFLAPLYRWENDERTANVKQPKPDQWLAFTYALLHSRWYVQSAPAALRTDFPRIPPCDGFCSIVVDQLAKFGRQLSELHAPRAGWQAFQTSDDRISNLQVDRGYPRIEITNGNVRVLIGARRCIAEVPIGTWNHRIGGVEVLKRFLRRRRGTTLLEWEAEHFRQIILGLAETAAIQQEINSLGGLIR